MTKVFEKLTISDSFMFDCVMADRAICRQFLSILQQKDVGELSSLEVEREFRITVDGKPIKLDIYAEEGQNRVYDTEMERLNHRKVESKHLPERTRFYQSVLDQSLIAKGQPYSAIKECVIIFVCTFDPFGKGRYVYTFRNVCIEDNSLELNDRCTKIFFNTKSEAPDIPKNIRNLFDYINKGSVSDDFTESLENSVRNVRSNERWKREYMHNFTDRQDIWEEAHEAGVHEGLERGIEQTKRMKHKGASA